VASRTPASLINTHPEFFGLPGGAVTRWHGPVEHDSVHDVFGDGDGEALPHGPQRDLVDHRSVQLLDPFDRPGSSSSAACLDVSEVPRRRDLLHRGQPVFDNQLTRLRPVGDLELVGEAAGVFRLRKHLTEKRPHRIRQPRPEVASSSSTAAL
jgi:hypothetical protein